MVHQNLILHFNEGIEFIKDALSKDGTVLVHWYKSTIILINIYSNAGVSRSASFVIGKCDSYYKRTKKYLKIKRIAFWLT